MSGMFMNNNHCQNPNDAARRHYFGCPQTSCLSVSGKLMNLDDNSQHGDNDNVWLRNFLHIGICYKYFFDDLFFDVFEEVMKMIEFSTI